MAKFKAGDKVRVKKGGCPGLTGEIAFIRNSHLYPYMVSFDKNVNMIESEDLRAKEAIEKGYDYRKCWIYADNELELVEEKKMENVKNLLKSGDIVIVRNGGKYRVYPDYKTGVFTRIDDIGFNRIEEYNDSLLVKPLKGSSQYDIMKIYRADNPIALTSSNLNDYWLVWEREEIKEMSMEEICAALGYEVKIKREE